MSLSILDLLLIGSPFDIETTGVVPVVEVKDGLLFIARQNRLHYRVSFWQAALYVGKENRLHYEAKDA